MVNLSVNEPNSRPWKNDLLTEGICDVLQHLLLKPVMATCGITVSVFPDYSGTTSVSLQNFPEMNKLSICLGKSFFFSPGLCENFGQFQTKLEIVSVCTHDCVCVYECMSDCLYASRRGGGLCFDSIRCTDSNLPLLHLSLSVMHHSYENEAERQRDRKLFLNNKRQPVCFQDLTLPLT